MKYARKPETHTEDAEVTEAREEDRERERLYSGRAVPTPSSHGTLGLLFPSAVLSSASSVPSVLSVLNSAFFL
jgi:hypothetical protein